MSGEGYEQRAHQIYFWVISDSGSPDYWGAGVVKDALYDSFRPLENVKGLNPPCSQSYGKDAAHVFYRGRIIEGADLATFEIMESVQGQYAKDKQSVYFEGKRISDRAQQFRLFNGAGYATDGEQAFYYGKLIGAGNLELLPGNEGLARIDTQLFSSGQLVQDASPSNFTLHSENCWWRYGTDSKHVFLDNKPVPGADPETFKELGHCTAIYRDERMVYIWTRELPEVHRDTARVLDRSYLADDSAVYRVFPHTQDYVGGIVRMADRDIASFMVVDGSEWTKDKSGVYYRDEKVPEADPVTFKRSHVGNGTGEDKNYRYDRGQISCKFDEKSPGEVWLCN